MISFPFSVTDLTNSTEVSVGPAPDSRGPAVYLDVWPLVTAWDGDDAPRVQVSLSPLACRELATALLVAAHKAEPKEAHADALRVAAAEVRP